MSELLKSFSLLNIRNIAILLFSVARAKILAVLLGPAGLSIVSQAVNLHNFLWSTSTAGTNRGSTILVAHYVAERDFSRINNILFTSFLFLTITGTMVNVGCAVFAGQISAFIFGSQKYAHFVMIVAAASWFAIQHSLIVSLLRGLLKIGAYTISSVLGYLLTIVSILMLVYFFGLAGAVMSILAGQMINLLVGVSVLRKYALKQWPEIGFFRGKASKTALLQILNYIGPLLIHQIILGGGILILRSEIIRRLGEDANGVYQVVWGISMIYITLFNDIFSSYLLPKIASHLNNVKEVVWIQNTAIRLCLFLLAPFLILLLSMREFLILLLYSREFLVAGTLMIWQFSGDMFAVLIIGINAALIPHKKFAFLIFEEGLKWGVWISLSLLLVPNFGLLGIPMGYFVTNGIGVSICILYQYRVMGFRISQENLRLIAKLLPLAAIGFLSAELISFIWLRILVAAVWIFLMSMWLPTKTEKQKAFSWLIGFLSNRDDDSRSTGTKR
jgi:O-antigen/teichoic acid export membrane protein